MDKSDKPADKIFRPALPRIPMTFGEFMAHRDKLHRARGVLHLKIHPEEQSPPEPPGTQCDENED
ncbi:MAG TPA: hypothetical protein VL177_05495 [Terriglobales bacterium]|jgi:hypothetical protein|nr:hypothetical protein [Terriglobales bacterium]